MTSNDAMVTAAHSSEPASQAPDVRLVVDAIPTFAWSARADGSADFFNRRWLDYTGQSRTMGSGAEFRVGPHIMIIGLDQKTMQTLNQDASNGEPYVNSLPGHSELYLVIPIRQWDDAQAVPSIGAEAR